MIPLALLSCQEPSWPEDARQVLLWHAARTLEDAGGAPDAADWRDRLYAYQAAGAESEAWAAARALDLLAPADADGDRYRVQLCVWDPAHWSEGQSLAERWLKLNVDRPEPERQAVAAAQSVLTLRLAARAETAKRQHGRVWVPWLALALVLGGSALVLKGPR